MSRWLCMVLAGGLAVSGVRAEPVEEAEAKSGLEATAAAEAPAEADAEPASTNQVVAVQGHWQGPDVYVYTNALWMLEITYLNPDTRSEGQQGRLLEDGKPVTADKKGVSLVTPLGLMKYYGSERKNAWDVTGWNFADRRQIRRSSELPRPSSAK